ncbi:MAG: hypothetical protein IT521_11575 [Burkholderiales bacterium]|nr:hypothetical protein [Burkholderiales bacterium]
MRIKNHWFRPGRTKSPQEIAGAAAFIAWRTAQDALKTMRSAHYELPPGREYFAFVTEFLVFLTLGADRLAYRRGDDAWRVAFTTAVANRAGEILAENEADLLGAATSADVKARFIARVNEAAAECAEFDWTEEGPDYGFLRYLGQRIAENMQPQERTWAISQVIEVQAPDAAAHLHRGMAGLLEEAPRPRERGARATGE